MRAPRGGHPTERVAVEENLAAFRLGRAHVAEGRSVASLDGSTGPAPTGSAAVAGTAGALASLVARRRQELVEFQDETLAQEYAEFVERVATAERKLGQEPGELTEAVARHLYGLMAYKDEYEVARLLTSGEGQDQARRVADELGGRLTYRLHPPLLREWGLDHKIGIPAWAMPGLGLLASGKRLRGTRLDPFGRAEVRRVERQLIGEYRAAIERVIADLDESRIGRAVEIARLPDLVRGYETLKLERAAEFRRRLAESMAAYVEPSPVPASVA
ncbi:MAG: DUF6537 domain-containing protein [Ilumatobacteraceae bacterium]